MIVALVLAVAAGFRADFPDASVVEAPGRGLLTHASGFAASGFGTEPEAAARAFLEKYAAEFGVGPRQQLVALQSPARSVRFERRIDGLPVFSGDIVVGVDGASSIVRVNSGAVPPEVRGRHRISPARARAVAKAPRSAPAVRGWRAEGEALHPVWRVETRDWTVFVDAETGTEAFRAPARRR